MAKYKPEIVEHLAVAIETIAWFIMIMGGIVGALLGLGGGSAVGGGGVGLILAIIGAAIGFGYGYVFTLLFRAIAQLMLTLVAIERNTSGNIDASQFKPKSRSAGGPIVDDGGRARVPSHIQESYKQARALHDAWVVAERGGDDELFYDETESAVEERAEFIVAFEKVVELCASEESGLCPALAPRARRDFAAHISDREVRAIVERMESFGA